MTEDTEDSAADLAAELGFEPAVADRDAPAKSSATRRPRKRTALRRRVGSFGVLIAALTSMGGAYAAFASTSGAAGSADTAASVAHGRQLFSVSCITCHGANLQGVKGRGPSLVGVGGSAAYFQVITGRMPLAQQGAYSARKTPKFDDEETRAIAAYIQSVGGGPAIPTGTLRGPSSSVAEGGALYRLNCASCHGVTFKGAPLSAGKIAPSLNAATDLQIATAMLSGPESMPVFSNNQLTVAQKQAIVAYIQTIKASDDPGGSGIDRIGPVSEAIVLWVAGVGLLMVAILWIGARSQ
ncbi:MAG: cytochrome bc1 complex diheme cytochrome c subunit [Jatrophihabitantaceae bacterium]